MSEVGFDVVEWIQHDFAKVPGSPYIMKYMIKENSYSVVVTDLITLYAEKLTGKDIEERFNKDNMFTQMKAPVILEYLSKSLEERSSIEFEDGQDPLVMSVVFSTKPKMPYDIPCAYMFNLKLKPPCQLRSYVLNTTILGGLLGNVLLTEKQKKGVLSGRSTPPIFLEICPFQDPVDPEKLDFLSLPNDTMLEAFMQMQATYKDVYSSNLGVWDFKAAKMKKFSEPSSSKDESSQSSGTRGELATASTSVPKKFKKAEHQKETKAIVYGDDTVEGLEIRTPSSCTNSQRCKESSKNERKNKKFKI